MEGQGMVSRDVDRWVIGNGHLMGLSSRVRHRLCVKPQPQRSIRYQKSLLKMEHQPQNRIEERQEEGWGEKGSANDRETNSGGVKGCSFPQAALADMRTGYIV